MKVRNCTINHLENALEIINKKYQGNVTFNRLEQKRFTLRVKDSSGPGARRGFHNNRKLVSACWHVHGDFFDALFKVKPDAEVFSSSTGWIDRFHGNWIDFGVGSMVYPKRMSEMCKCE
jgi:hypothetical protein